MSKPRLLCVDDERNVIEGITDNLRSECVVIPATSGAEALVLLEADPTIAVIMSDMRMPGMDGATLLARARALRPDVPRILLTGQADMASAIAAVNNGQLFRFLTKPCGREQLKLAIHAAFEQHRLLSAERVLLEDTLHGSIATLVDILAMTNPVSFGRANRVKSRASKLAIAYGLPSRWQVETAALLQPVGHVTLPPETAERLRQGHVLSEDEKRMVARLPAITDQLLAHIPRLEDVRAILTGAARPTAPRDTFVDTSAAILRAAGELDDLEVQGKTAEEALEVLRGRSPAYSERVFDALTMLAASEGPRVEVHEVTLPALRVGMIFAEDVKLVTGALLVARGYQITSGFLERVSNFPAGALRMPLRVAVQI